MPRILMIDDDMEFRLVLKDALTHEGYEVLAAADGVRGLQLVLERLPDLILLDVRMPNRDGLETLRLIRVVQPEARVIIMSGALTEEQRTEAQRWGVTRFLKKPAGAQELLDVLSAALKSDD